MVSTLGSITRPLRIAIIGCGPSGFYAAEALLQQKHYAVSIDMFDHLPTPYGLVRYGVAPDHQKIKLVTKLYDRIAADARVRFFGHVTLGKEVQHEAFKRYYDQIVYAVGTQADRRLGIPGEELERSYPATRFVAWYNGHPDYAQAQFDLSIDKVAVIGVGNVAMDVARILARSPNELQRTDIADYALEALRRSQVKDIYVIARRGPAQIKFTPTELKELAGLEEADVIVKNTELNLDPYSMAALKNNRTATENLGLLHRYARQGTSGKPKRIHFLFLRSPVEIVGQSGKVAALRLEKNELRPTETGYLQSHGIGTYETMPVGMVVRSVGYRGVPIPGVPFDFSRGVIANEAGRVKNIATGQVVPGEYVVGWAKRGPRGVIGTNKPDAAATVQRMLEDVDKLQPVDDANASPEAILDLLRRRRVRYVTWTEWQRIDQAEQAAGRRLGRPRVKFTSITDMLALIEQDRKIGEL